MAKKFLRYIHERCFEREYNLNGILEGYESEKAGKARTLEKYRILRKRALRNLYPCIVGVAEVLDETSDVHNRMGYSFQPFYDLRVKNTKQYLRLLLKGDKKAIEVYEMVKRAYGYEDPNPNPIEDFLNTPSLSRI